MVKRHYDNLVSNSSKLMLDESDEHESSSDEEELEHELADVSFGELQKARSNGFHILHHKSRKGMKDGRLNKNRPMEISSKKPVSRFRKVIDLPRKGRCDPRFEALYGILDTDRFKKNYNFYFETLLPAEKEKLKKLVKKSSDPNVIADLKNHISLIDKQLKARPSKDVAVKAILSELKKKEREAVKQGKHPYYTKKAELREKALIEQYNHLKAAGNYESFMERKRRKNASKDGRKLPRRRNNIE